MSCKTWSIAVAATLWIGTCVSQAPPKPSTASAPTTDSRAPTSPRERIDRLLERIAPLGADVHYGVVKWTWRWSAADEGDVERTRAWQDFRAALEVLRPAGHDPDPSQTATPIPDVAGAVAAIQRLEEVRELRSLVTSIGFTSLQRPQNSTRIAVLRTVSLTASLRRLSDDGDRNQLTILPRNGGMVHDEPLIAFSPLPVADVTRQHLLHYEWRHEDRNDPEVQRHVAIDPEGRATFALLTRTSDGLPLEAAQWNQDNSRMAWVKLEYPRNGDADFWPELATQVTVTPRSGTIDQRRIMGTVLGVDPEEMRHPIPAGTQVFDQRGGLDLRLGAIESVLDQLPEVVQKHLYRETGDDGK